MYPGYFLTKNKPGGPAFARCWAGLGARDLMQSRSQGRSMRGAGIDAGFVDGNRALPQMPSANLDLNPGSIRRQGRAAH
jgi:hypothetical protein